MSTAPATVSTGGLEMTLGGRWTAWLGAAAVVVAVGFFFKMAVDRGWWGGLSETMRCLLGVGLGGLLIGAGEITLRKLGKAASVGCFAAGLGALYVVAYAASQHYELLAEAASFVLMGLVTGGGVLISLRTRFRTIGVLSLLAGYITPLLLLDPASTPLLEPVYLTALLAIALLLSAAAPGTYRPLRYVALGAHTVPAFVWIVGNMMNGTAWVAMVVYVVI
ncbi:MAG: DUF2339 domain-containing protein, partial [Planctomycetota bacterium]